MSNDRVLKAIYEASHNYEYLFCVVAEHIKETRDMAITDAHVDHDYSDRIHDYYHILVVRGKKVMFSTYSVARAIEWALEQPLAQLVTDVDKEQEVDGIGKRR